MKNKKIITIVAVIILAILIISALWISRVIQKRIEDKQSDSEQNRNQKYAELEKIPLDYDFSQMVEDKCYIVSDANIVYHKEELDNFIKNVENEVPDEIRIVRYTVEEQPVLVNLEYVNHKFILKTDNRRDGYAAREDKKITTSQYDEKKYKLVKESTPNYTTDTKSSYSLELKQIEGNKTIPICSYVEVKKSENEKFKILFNKNTTGNERTKILGKEESDKYDYDIYAYKGTVDIIISGEKMSLREALINNKITVEEILEKAAQDAREDKTIFGDIYLDGGSSFFLYNDYQILKYNTLEGDRDLYIGVPSMDINKIQK